MTVDDKARGKTCFGRGKRFVRKEEDVDYLLRRAGSWLVLGLKLNCGLLSLGMNI